MQGNPRLLELYAAMPATDTDSSDFLRLSHEPSVQPLFSRLWKRLDAEERTILGALSVFRSYSPHEIWAGSEAALSGLITRSIVKTDLSGGIALLPFVRDMVYNILPQDQRRHMHLEAANVRAQFGDYTASAHHFVQAGDLTTAVELWFAHQDAEILLGQATIADELFRNIDVDLLEGIHRTKLLVIQNRLALLAGEVERVLEGMEGYSWETDDETSADVVGQLAYAYEFREQTDSALLKYDEAIAIISRATTKIAHWRLRRGLILSESDTQAALREAELAEYDIERLRGTIDYMAGRYGAAFTHFQNVLLIGERAADKDKIARAHQQLSLLAGRQGNMEQALFHADKAMTYFAEIGDRMQIEGVRAELAGMYLNIRQFDPVIELSEKALQFFERVKHDLWISTISTNLAEAYMETGRLDQAKEMAFRALRMENPNARPYALYTLGHIHDREGNPAHATVSFNEGIEVARANGDPFIEAYLQRALGALQSRNGQGVEGAEHLEAALSLFTEMGLEHEIAETKAALQSIQSVHSV
jgi:tetratricopeptide (TPR) repeat protein